MKYRILLTSAAIACLMLSPAANAQQTERRQTMRTTAGDIENNSYFAFNTNYALNYEGDDSFHGMNLSTRIGYDINPNVAVELESGWMFYNAENGIDAGTLHIVPLLGNIVLKQPIEERLVPYVSGGFGVFFYGFNESDTLENVGAEVDLDNASVGFKVAAGADYWFDEDWALNLETGYFFIPDPDATATVGGTKFTGEADVDAWYIGAGFKFRFG